MIARAVLKPRARVALQLAVFALAAASFLIARSPAEEPVPRVECDVSKSTPRQVEELTERGITRDYKNAWQNLAMALSSNSRQLIDAYFAGPVRDELAKKVTSQNTSGLRSSYLNQSHKLETVFYSPEGDVMELHDTAEFDLQITSDGKAIHREHVVERYVVLMTPSADHWVVRQLQAVPQF